MYLISPTKKQYKANLHCHSTVSDGRKTPKELKEMYKKEGYSILAITDHEYPESHAYLCDDEFLAITGYESHIRDNPNFDAYAKEIHLNLFAKDQNNKILICCNDDFCLFIPPEKIPEFKKAGNTRKREYSVSYINEFIKTARECGYLVSYNHPNWSLGEESEILGLDGFFSLEMFNYNSYLWNGLEYNGALYNKLLSKGKRVFCHSVDDNHNRPVSDSAISDSFGGFTMIYPEKFTYSSVIDAMEKGEMYSSTGPIFKEISMDKNKIHIECSKATSIRVFTGAKTTLRKFAPVGKTITSADFEIDKFAKFVRVCVIDKDGKRADTRGYFRDELEL